MSLCNIRLRFVYVDCYFVEKHLATVLVTLSSSVYTQLVVEQLKFLLFEILLQMSKLNLS